MNEFSSLHNNLQNKYQKFLVCSKAKICLCSHSTGHRKWKMHGCHTLHSMSDFAVCSHYTVYGKWKTYACVHIPCSTSNTKCASRL